VPVHIDQSVFFRIVQSDPSWILLQPEFSIQPQYYVVNFHRKRRNGVYCTCCLINTLCYASFSIKFEMLTAGYSPRLNYGVCYGDDQANETRRPGTLSMNDVSNG
jgi:hypothetical protein